MQYSLDNQHTTLFLFIFLTLQWESIMDHHQYMPWRLGTKYISQE